MDNNKLINQFIANLDKKGLDSSLLESDLFNFNQKFVLYNAISSGANLDVLASPDIDAYEMEDILDEQHAMMKEMRNNHGINPEYYNMSQLLELNDALALNKFYPTTHQKLTRRYTGKPPQSLLTRLAMT